MDDYYCPACEARVPADGWLFKPRGTHAGRSSYCRVCTKKKAREYYLANREKWNGYNRKRRFGLTEGDFDALLEKQGRVCAICRTDTPGGRGTFHVDHDHACCPGETTCGKCIRGLLCVRCNTAIGMTGDNADLLRAAAAYLDKIPGD